MKSTASVAWMGLDRPPGEAQGPAPGQDEKIPGRFAPGDDTADRLRSLACARRYDL